MKKTKFRKIFKNKIFLKKNLKKISKKIFQKKNSKKKFQKKISKKKFVDLRWAQLYVSLVCP